MAVTPAASETSLLRAEAERIRLMERCRLGGDEGEGEVERVAKQRGEVGEKKGRKKKSKVRAAKEGACLKMERGEMTGLIMKVQRGAERPTGGNGRYLI